MYVLPETAMPGSNTSISYLAVILKQSAWVWGLKEWRPLWKLPFMAPELLFPNARYCVCDLGYKLCVATPQAETAREWSYREREYVLFSKSIFYVPGDRLLVVFGDEICEVVARVYTTDGELVEDIRSRYSRVRRATFSPASMCLLVVDRVWATWFDVNNGQQLGQFNTYNEHGHYIEEVQFSHNGNYLLTSEGKDVIIWRFPEMAPCNILALGRSFSASPGYSFFSPDDRYLVLISRMPPTRVIIYNVQRGTVLHEMNFGEVREADGFFLDRNNFCLWYEEGEKLLLHRITIYDTAPPRCDLLGVIDARFESDFLSSWKKAESKRPR